MIYHNILQKPGALCIRASGDRIDAAAKGNIFDLQIESLLSMSPMNILQQALGGRVN